MSTVARPNDYLYDPLFTVSGEKDYYKAAMAAKLSSAKYAICPIFPNMFSDLPHQPRQVIVMRKTNSVPQFEQLPQLNKSVDIHGVDRYKFFHWPLISKCPSVTTPKYVFTPPSSPQKSTRKRNKIVQTKYRESSAQTIPWQPSNYIITDDSNPELLMLDFLKWGSGLPAGMHEVRLIERARMKRAWENSLPPVTDEASLEKRRALTEAMERDEWAFREQEIQDIQDLRLQLLVEMLNELHTKSHVRTEMKLKSFCKTKLAEKDEKLKTLRRNADREMRKLEMKHRGIKTSYHPVDVIDECIDRKSELYAPFLRHGENPKRWHQVIDEDSKQYKAQYMGVEDVGTLPRWLDEATLIKDSSINLPGTRLCIRETKWTSQVLKELHDDLKVLRKKEKPQKCSLKVKKEEQEIPMASTPQVQEGDDVEEQLHQSVMLIESVLRGRASQVLIFEGRDRCRELIQELRSTHALQDNEREKIFYERLKVKSHQREYALCVKNARMLKESLNKLSSNVVGTLLDFLNKELRRLLDERRIHAMCLAFERERHNREAAEAGRRQAELRRRKEHDEIFKQVAKVTQDSVDLYLEGIITEGMEFTSKTEATDYVKRLAGKIDEEVHFRDHKSTYEEEEELIANLVHNFLLPEAEKTIIRDKIKKKQHNRLKAAHDCIYSQYDHLPKAEPKPMAVEEQSSDETEETVCSVSQILMHEPKDCSSSHVTIIYNATKAGHTDFEQMSQIHPVMESLINKEDTASTMTTGSSAIPIKPAETNLDIETLEEPLGFSQEIVKKSKSSL